MTACTTHTLAIPPKMGEVGNWKETFKRKRGYEPKKCEVCGYFIYADVPIEVELRGLKGSIKDYPELEKKLNLSKISTS